MKLSTALAACFGVLTGLTAVSGAARAADTATSTSYPTMAPIAQYRIPNPEEEARLARSAAPASISANAEILVLGTHGFETYAKGTNGFVCLVERSWDAGFDDPVFWNSKIRGPDCLNPTAARSVLPHFLERTRWVLSGLSKDEMITRTKAELAAGTYVMPEAGAMAFMMSKEGYLSDEAHHWHPHLMFFVANTKAAAWGADLPASPVMASANDIEPVTTFFVPIAKWSDGTPDAMEMK